ncbi:MAG TPA: hypothetical protein VMP08_03625 [Anaerolineae bacterium]|nr:hypothetical protein [Anaerolineae bacterium]
MTIDFYGLPACSLVNDYLRIDYLTTAGPRLIRLILNGSTDNLLAETPAIHWPTPWGDYHLRGGHRVTVAPEALELSYVPDNDGVLIEDVPGGVRLMRPADASGISKSIEIQLHPDRPALTLQNSVCNERSEPIEIAAWAITQLALGGIAVAPLRTTSIVDRHRPDRQLVLWPYASWQNERLFADDEYVWIDAQSGAEELKIGLLARGWLGYLRSGVFFLKRFDPQLALPHPDLNTNAQLYCNHSHLELETLAPLTLLEPGQSSVQLETWELYQVEDVPSTMEGLDELLRSLHLD